MLFLIVESPVSSYFSSMMGAIILGIVLGSMYGFLFITHWTRTFSIFNEKQYTLFLRITAYLVLGGALFYLLHSPLIGSILMGISFLIAFWIVLLVILENKHNERY